jgi:molybdopterin converting factor subunit 1
MVKVLFFATLKDRAGTRQAEFDLPEGTTIGTLKSMLAVQFPGLKGTMEHCISAIDHSYHADDFVIPKSAEVAFFPPVSGG